MIIFTVIFIAGCNTQSKETQEANPLMEKYDSYIESFSTTTTSEVNSQIANENSFFLYTGRRTCPHCQIFAPKLYNIGLLSKHDNITINYLNSEDPDDEGLDSFRETYDIPYVPNFSYFENGELIDSMSITDNSTEEDIDNFIMSMKQ